MLTLLVKAIRERLASRLWWTFVFYALAAVVLFRFGMTAYSLSAMSAAQNTYRKFLATARVNLFQRLASLPGANKFLAVIKARNPDTGEMATNTVWLLADDAVQAYERIHSGEWGQGMTLVSLSHNSVSADLEALKSITKGWGALWTQAKAHPQVTIEQAKALFEEGEKEVAAFLAQSATPLPQFQVYGPNGQPSGPGKVTPTLPLSAPPPRPLSPLAGIIAKPAPVPAPPAALKLVAPVPTGPPLGQTAKGVVLDDIGAAPTTRLMTRLVSMGESEDRTPWGAFLVNYIVHFTDGSIKNAQRTFNYAFNTPQDRIAGIAVEVEKSIMEQATDTRVIASVELQAIHPQDATYGAWVKSQQTLNPASSYLDPHPADCPFNYCDAKDGEPCKGLGHCRHRTPELKTGP